jgi:hypothetical protein
MVYPSQTGLNSKKASLRNSKERLSSGNIGGVAMNNSISVGSQGFIMNNTLINASNNNNNTTILVGGAPGNSTGITMISSKKLKPSANHRRTKTT